jgi:hypothetical protein
MPSETSVAAALMKANCIHEFAQLYLLMLSVGGSANGGRDEKMSNGYYLTIDCNGPKELLKGIVTSLYSTRLK